MRFGDTISTVEQLRTFISAPHPAALAKEHSSLDKDSIAFIGRSPFVLIGSSDGGGIADVSPRGDRPGFVRILDERTVAIPDRKGNRRLDTFQNVLEHPVVALLFMVPGDQNTLRVRGQASIVRDQSLRNSMAIEADVPELALAVHISALYFHCAKSINRSELWGNQRTGP